ncbi:MAG TPA: hypothetical protein VGT44_06605 [Ktedonobacteraceae bacterium]|nr:hypothetical protein [Ktedonobacteraceae bacterium]
MLLRGKQITPRAPGRAAIVIIALALALRIGLTLAGWPPTNSDESTMGIMAIHIIHGKDFPIFLYGQLYMGALEAYIAAGLMHVGETLFALRLANMLLFTLALTSFYLLASLLYTKKVALITIALLSIGSVMMIFTELMAHGGYPEIISLGVTSFLLAAYLALTSNQQTPLYRQWKRLLAYFGWGLASALGFWGDYIMLPIILMTGLLILLFCWRELLKGAILPVLLGLLIGGIPLILYNLSSPPTTSTLAVIWSLRNNFTPELTHSVYYQFRYFYEAKGTLLVSLPMATGAPPLCFDSGWVVYGRGGGFAAFQCLNPQAPTGLIALSLIWSAGFLVLWLLSTTHELAALWRLRRFAAKSPALRQEVIRHFARLALLLCAALILLEFTLSPVSAVFSAAARYLTGLLIATPVIIAPLCGYARDRSVLQSLVANNPDSSPPRRSLFVPFSAVLRWGGLLFIAVVLLAGTFSIFSELPTVRAVDGQQQALITDLTSIHVTHFYTDYWTCNRLAFLSDERLICAVLDSNLNETHTRPPGYYAIVKGDPRSAYMFPLGSVEADKVARLFAQSKQPYRRSIFEGYVVYQPLK